MIRVIWNFILVIGYASLTYHAWVGLENYAQLWRWLITAMLTITGLINVGENINFYTRSNVEDSK